MTPFMHVDDVAAAVRFFTGVLGFAATVEREEYAYVEREGAALRILCNSPTPGEGAPPGNRRYMYYVDVRDLAALLAELRPRLAGLPAGHVYGPVDQSYGQRELTIVAPDNNLVVFGQGIPALGASS